MSTKIKKVKIGSRGSRLALLQAEKVVARLKSLFPGLEFENRVITTSGDQSAGGRLTPAAEGWVARNAAESIQGMFTKEIDEALLSGVIDMAVHSAKDLPTQILPRLRMGAVLEREDVRDAWISRASVPLAQMPPYSVVGTTSPRRRAQILSFRPDVEVVEMRGNVPTRLAKMKQGACGGLVLAVCGLARLGLAAEITEYLDRSIMIPAVGQGAIAVEIRSDDGFVEGLMKSLNHEESFLRIEAERSLLRSLRGGCQIPVGAFSQVSGEILSLEACLFSLDGTRRVQGRMEGKKTDAGSLGEALAERLKQDGGLQILKEIRTPSLQVPEP